MLIENGHNASIQIGATVRIKSTGAVGKIVGYQNGKWRVEVANTGTVLQESSNLTPTQALFG